MSLFRGARPAPTDAARSALRDTGFPCAIEGLTVQLDYDASVWTRQPRQGEDRTAWVEQHTAAYAADLGLAPGDPQLAAARQALEEAADRLVTHTVDLVALPQPARGLLPAVLYVDVLDEELGLLEHGAPDVFLGFDDIVPGTKVEPKWFPVGRDRKAFRYSTLSDPAARGPRRFLRAHRLLDVGGGAVHVYAMAFYDAASSLEHVLPLLGQVRVSGPSDR